MKPQFNLEKLEKVQDNIFATVINFFENNSDFKKDKSNNVLEGINDRKKP